MNSKTILILAIATVALMGAGLLLESNRSSSSAWSKADQPLFEDLIGQLESVTALVIQGPDGVTTVTRDGERWTVSERGGYLGRGDEVGRVLMGLADAKRLEPKTSLEENYSRLGLAGFEDESSPTVRVTVKAGEEQLVDLFIGKRRLHGGGESWYVREPDGDTIWAVEGKLRLPRRTSEWLDTELLSITRDRIAQVFVAPAGGAQVEFAREDTSQSGFDLLNLPEGRELKTGSNGAGLAGALDRLRLQDVAPDDGLAGDPTTITTFWSEDGLKIVCELWEQEVDEVETLRCRFTPSIDESRAPAAAMGPALEPDPDQAPTDGPDPRAALEQEVAQLREQTEGWIYTLPSWKKTSFLVSMEDLLEEVQEEDEDEDGGESAADPVEGDDETKAEPPVEEGDQAPPKKGSNDEKPPGGGKP